MSNNQFTITRHYLKAFNCFTYTVYMTHIHINLYTEENESNREIFYSEIAPMRKGSLYNCDRGMTQEYSIDVDTLIEFMLHSPLDDIHSKRFEKFLNSLIVDIPSIEELFFNPQTLIKLDDGYEKLFVSPTQLMQAHTNTPYDSYRNWSGKILESIDKGDFTLFGITSPTPLIIPSI